MAKKVKKHSQYKKIVYCWMMLTHAVTSLSLLFKDVPTKAKVKLKTGSFKNNKAHKSPHHGLILDNSSQHQDNHNG